jgi:hypothetical protein
MMDMDILKEITAIATDNIGAIPVMIAVGIIQIIAAAWIYKKIKDNIDPFIDDCILELLVKIPITRLQNEICSYRLGVRDIEIMSQKGYKVFDADKGRFIKTSDEWEKTFLQKQKVWREKLMSNK